MNLQRKVFERLYQRASSVDSLPWHREQPPALLERVVAQRPVGGRALDLGCGQGVHAVYLAQRGFTVVAVDFVQDALAAARTRVAQAGVEVDLRECDVLDFEAPSGFDIVLDSGCLHHVPRGKVGAYRLRLDEWLAPGGDYVLVHFSHRPTAVWIPKGPRHMSRDEAVAFFAPLELRAYDETHFDVPFPIGGMRAGIYWFSRPGPSSTMTTTTHTNSP